MDMSEIELKKHPETGEIVPEEWREIDGYDGWYEVSNYGRVRSWKNGRWGRREEPRLLSVITGKVGYLIVGICHDGEKTEYVHRLVAGAFIPNDMDKPQVNHIDGNKENSFVFNLEWCTSEENISHAYATGLTNNKGEDNWSSKLSEDDVLMIRKMHRDGNYFHRELGDMFGVSRRHIGKIVNGEIWTDVVL